MNKAKIYHNRYVLTIISGWFCLNFSCFLVEFMGKYARVPFMAMN